MRWGVASFPQTVGVKVDVGAVDHGRGGGGGGGGGHDPGTTPAPG